jgi:hypothetical protein
MNKLYVIAGVLIFIFLISYNPKTGVPIEQYLPRKEKYEETPGPDASSDPRLQQCDEMRYAELQFGSPVPCSGEPKEYLGAVF